MAERRLTRSMAAKRQKAEGQPEDLPLLAMKEGLRNRILQDLTPAELHNNDSTKKSGKQVDQGAKPKLAKGPWLSTAAKPLRQQAAVPAALAVEHQAPSTAPNAARQQAAVLPPPFAFQAQALPQPQRPKPQCLPDPEWPPESPPAPRNLSVDATSKLVGRLPLLTLDQHEAAAAGSSLTSTLEALLFCPYSHVNPSLATRNRKTEYDLAEPSEPVQVAVAAMESLRKQLARLSSSTVRSACMQQSWTSLFGKAFGAAGGGSMEAILRGRIGGDMLFAQTGMEATTQIMLSTAKTIDTALAGTSGGMGMIQACFEILQRFCFRQVLPFDPFGGVFTFAALLERALCAWAPTLQQGPASWTALPHDTGSWVMLTLEHLTLATEILEEATHSRGEEFKATLCTAILRDLALAALSDPQRPPPSSTTAALSMLEPAASATHSQLWPVLEQAGSCMLHLRTHSQRVAAVVEVTEKACRLMRCPWPPVCAAVFSRWLGAPAQG